MIGTAAGRQKSLTFVDRRRSRSGGAAGPNRPGTMARAARRPRTADGGPSGPLRNVPPPSERWPRASGGPERTGKGAETTQLAPRMIRPAVTLTRDLVRRRHPTGASPSRRNAPGRTLSPMPSEQKGAYGGHLALFCHLHRETDPAEKAWVGARTGSCRGSLRLSPKQRRAGRLLNRSSVASRLRQSPLISTAVPLAAEGFHRNLKRVHRIPSSGTSLWFRIR